jgi:hypothetical protein
MERLLQGPAPKTIKQTLCRSKWGAEQVIGNNGQKRNEFVAPALF